MFFFFLFQALGKRLPKSIFNKVLIVTKKKTDLTTAAENLIKMTALLLSLLFNALHTLTD